VLAAAPSVLLDEVVVLSGKAISALARDLKRVSATRMGEEPATKHEVRHMGFYVTTFLIGGLIIGTGALQAQAGEKKADAKHVNADNTKRNRGDEKSGSPTADDQSNDKASVEITAKIRRALQDSDGLSTNAHNVKIITNKQQVILRGPVSSADEKQRVYKLAADVAGARAVTNELEVISK
jgi:osmotically-inducible protein OsmY